MRTKPLFEHRHYVEIARIIAAMPAFAASLRTQRDSVISTFASELANSNPLFDRDRFVAAAMGTPTGRDKP